MVWMPFFLKRILYSHKPFDRRMHPRSFPKQEIECSCIRDEFGQKVESPLVIINVSRAGMLVSTNEAKIYPHTPIQVKFKAPSLAEPILVDAEIVRTYRRKDMRFYYSGLKFTDRNDKNVQLLLDTLLKT